MQKREGIVSKSQLRRMATCGRILCESCSRPMTTDEAIAGLRCEECKKTECDMCSSACPVHSEAARFGGGK